MIAAWLTAAIAAHLNRSGIAAAFLVVHTGRHVTFDQIVFHFLTSSSLVCPILFPLYDKECKAKS